MKTVKVDPHLFLAVFATISTFALLVLLFFKPLPHENKDLFNVLATAYVTGCTIGAYNFFFGSNKKQVDPTVQTTTVTEQKTIVPDIPISEEDKK